MKMHLANGGCGRGRHTTTDIRRVDCALCEKTEVFVAEKAKNDAAKQAAFLAQVPRTMGEPWKDGKIVCRSCGNDKFRIGDRTCMGHYATFVCADCGNKESRLTETGMSF